MTRPADTDAITRATGLPWADWLAWLDTLDATSMTHRDIARRVAEERGVDGWWAQTITVAYEQHIGRRAPGQSCTGDFSVGASRTVPFAMDGALALWVAWADRQPTFDGVALDGSPNIRETDKWRYWRCGLADGSRVNVNISQKAPAKSTIGVQHERLGDADAVARWRAFWRAALPQLSAPDPGA
jgi:hypothetical protein